MQNLPNQFTSGASTTWAEDDTAPNLTFPVQTADETLGYSVNYAFNAAGTQKEYYFNVSQFGPTWGPGVEILAYGTIKPIFSATDGGPVTHDAAVTNLWVNDSLSFTPNPESWYFTVYALSPLGSGGSAGTGKSSPSPSR